MLFRPGSKKMEAAVSRYRLFSAVLPLAVIQIISWGTIYFSFPLFIDPLHLSLGWSRTAISGGISIGLGTAAVIQFFFGRLIDRFGAHRVMCVGALNGAVAMLMLSANDSLFGYYLAWAILGTSIAMCFFEPAFAALLEQVPDQFERSVSILVLLSGFSSAVFLPLSHWTISKFGWRETLFFFFVFNLLSAIISFALLKTGQGRSYEEQCERKKKNESRSRNAGLLGINARTFLEPRFVCLAISFALNTLIVTTLVIHLLGFLLEKQFSQVAALAAISLIGPAQIGGRLAQTFLSEYVSRRLVAIFAFSAFFSGVLLLQFIHPEEWSLWVAITLIGVGSGMMTTLRGTIVASIFQENTYARVSGLIAAPSSLARAVAPLGASFIAGTMLGYGGLGWIICTTTALALGAISYSLVAYNYE